MFIPVLFSLFAAAAAREFPRKANLPANWVQLKEPVNPKREVTLKVALVPKDAEKLEKILLSIATPGSDNFREYLKKDQITEIVGRSEEDLARVIVWLNNAGAKVDQIPPTRDWIVATTTVESAEKIFNCELAVFENSRTSTRRIATKAGYSIPDELDDVVEMVAGMNAFANSRWSTPTTDAVAVAQLGVGADATAEVTPQTIYDTYQSPSDGSAGSRLGSQAVIEVGRLANFNDADLQTFFEKLQPDLVGETCGMAEGENNGDIRASVEANLDVQYMMAAGKFVNTTDYKLVSSEGIEDIFLDYTILVNSQNDPPLVHSLSYGEYGGSYDNATDQRFSYELQKMGVSGISVLLASGDNGVGCNSAGTSQEFDYPSSPYITMVGATYVDAKSKLEVGATLSSGGFSKDFMQASWQADAVNAYLAKVGSGAVPAPHEDYYAAGRAYPDMAAFGQNVQVVSAGSVIAVSGTSCSAPIFGGIVASLNDELLKAGKAPLGFLNPWMYANPQMFTDITEGSNPYQKCDGFSASAGWDPVTGLGTPLYPQMKEAAFANV